LDDWFPESFASIGERMTPGEAAAMNPRAETPRKSLRDNLSVIRIAPHRLVITFGLWHL
jgi:hypothetical protein